MSTDMVYEKLMTRYEIEYYVIRDGKLVKVDVKGHDTYVNYRRIHDDFAERSFGVFLAVIFLMVLVSLIALCAYSVMYT